MKKVRPLRLLFIEAIAFVYHTIYIALTGLRTSWHSAWSMISGIAGSIIFLFINKQIFFMIGFVLLVALMVLIQKEPNRFERAIAQIKEWQAIQITTSKLELLFYFPKYISANDNNEIEFVIQNGSDNEMQEVFASIRDESGRIIFDKTNSISTTLLLPGESVSQKMPFHVISNVGQSCITTTVMSTYKTENQDSGAQTVKDNTPILCPSAWRSAVVIYRQFPDMIQIIATYIGYISGLFAVIFLIFGYMLPKLIDNWRELVQKQR